jgi:hypothetical protein
MPGPLNTIDKISLAAMVIVSIAALVLTFLAPGFSFDNSLVYGAF